MLSVTTENSFKLSYVFSAFVEKWYLYLILFALFIAFILYVVFAKTKKRNNLSRTQKVAYVAVMSALCFIFNTVTLYPVNYIAISFLMTIGIVSGFMLGSKSAFLVCFIGDLLGAMIFPSGPYNPIIGIASGLMGFIPGVIFERFKWNNVIKVIVSAFCCLIVCTYFINTFGLWFMYSSGFWFQPKSGTKTFFAYLFIRMPWQTLVMVGNAVLSVLIVKQLERLLPKNKFSVVENENRIKSR